MSKKWEIVIREKKSKRSEEQNNRLWGYLYPSIGNHLGYSADDIHQLAGYKFLRSERNVQGNNITVIKSTTNLTIKEMAVYQQSIEIWASELGWSADE